METNIIESISFVGDLHLNSITPKSRIDNFPDTAIMKLNSLLDICINKNYRHIVFLGDFSHTPNQPIWFLNRLIDIFQKFQDNNIKCYSIYGNHDLVRNDLENADKSALGLMFKTGLIKELRTELFNTKEGYDIALHGFHYTEPIDPLISREVQAKVNICAMHRYFEYNIVKSSFTREQLSGIGYQVYATGHLHLPFEPTKINDFFMVRPGRFLRGTSDNFNTEDGTVYLDTIYFNGSIESPRITCIRDIVPTIQASQVFSILALNKDKDSKKFLSTLSNRVSELLNMMDTDSSCSNNLYKVLDKLNVDIRIKNRVEMYLQKDGIYRNSEEV